MLFRNNNIGMLILKLIQDDKGKHLLPQTHLGVQGDKR